MNTLAPHELGLWLKDGAGLQLVDVREPEEWDYVRMPQARLLPLARLETEWDSAGLDPSVRTVVYCHHGIRSLLGCGILEAGGFAKVYNLEGGIDRWAAEMEPSMRRY
jgi:adenylyltransferase/sulfurtransferase